eukprot:gene6676-13521_t
MMLTCSHLWEILVFRKGYILGDSSMGDMEEEGGGWMFIGVKYSKWRLIEMTSSVTDQIIPLKFTATIRMGASATGFSIKKRPFTSDYFIESVAPNIYVVSTSPSTINSIHPNDVIVQIFLSNSSKNEFTAVKPSEFSKLKIAKGLLLRLDLIRMMPLSVKIPTSSTNSSETMLANTAVTDTQTLITTLQNQLHEKENQLLSSQNEVCTLRKELRNSVSKTSYVELEDKYNEVKKQYDECTQKLRTADLAVLRLTAQSKTIRNNMNMKSSVVTIQDSQKEQLALEEEKEQSRIILETQCTSNKIIELEEKCKRLELQTKSMKTILNETISEVARSNYIKDSLEKELLTFKEVLTNKDENSLQVRLIDLYTSLRGQQERFDMMGEVLKDAQQRCGESEEKCAFLETKLSLYENRFHEELKSRKGLYQCLGLHRSLCLQFYHHQPLPSLLTSASGIVRVIGTDIGTDIGTGSDTYTESVLEELNGQIQQQQRLPVQTQQQQQQPLQDNMISKETAQLLLDENAGKEMKTDSHSNINSNSHSDTVEEVGYLNSVGKKLLEEKNKKLSAADKSLQKLTAAHDHAMELMKQQLEDCQQDLVLCQRKLTESRYALTIQQNTPQHQLQHQHQVESDPIPQTSGKRQKPKQITYKIQNQMESVTKDNDSNNGNDSSEKLISAMEQELKISEETIKTLERQLAVHEKERVENESRYIKLQRQLEDANKQLKFFQNCMKVCEAEIKEKDHQISVSEAVLTSMKSASLVDKICDEDEELRSELQAFLHKQQELEESLRTCKKEIQDRDTSLMAYVALLEESKARGDVLTAERDEINLQLAAIRKELEVKVSLNSVQRDKQRERIAAAAADKTGSSSSSALTTATAMILELELKIGELTTALSAAEADRDSLRRALHDATSTSTLRMISNIDSSASVEQETSTHDVHTEVQDKRSHPLSSSLSLRKQFDHVNDLLQCTKTKLQDSEKKVNELNKQVSMLRKGQIKLDEANKTLLKDVAEKIKYINELENKISCSRDSNSNDVNDANEVNLLRSELRTISNQLRDKEERLIDALVKYEECKTQLSETQRRVVLLEKHKLTTGSSSSLSSKSSSGSAPGSPSRPGTGSRSVFGTGTTSGSGTVLRSGPGSGSVAMAYQDEIQGYQDLIKQLQSELVVSVPKHHLIESEDRCSKLKKLLVDVTQKLHTSDLSLQKLKRSETESESILGTVPVPVAVAVLPSGSVSEGKKTIEGEGVGVNKEVNKTTDSDGTDDDTLVEQCIEKESQSNNSSSNVNKLIIEVNDVEELKAVVVVEVEVDWEKKNRELEYEILRLKDLLSTMVSDYELKISKYENELLSIKTVTTSTVTTSTSDKNESENQIPEDTETRIDTGTAIINNHTEIEIELKKQIEELKLLQDNSNTEILALTDRLESLQGHHSKQEESSQKRIFELMSLLQVQQDRFNVLGEVVKDSQQRKGELEIRYNEAVQRCIDLEDILTKVTSDNSNLDEVVRKYHHRESEMERSVLITRKQLEEALRELAVLRKQNESVTKGMHRSADIQFLEKQVDDLRKRLEFETVSKDTIAQKANERVEHSVAAVVKLDKMLIEAEGLLEKEIEHRKELERQLSDMDRRMKDENYSWELKMKRLLREYNLLQLSMKKYGSGSGSVYDNESYDQHDDHHHRLEAEAEMTTGVMMSHCSQLPAHELDHGMSRSSILSAQGRTLLEVTEGWEVEGNSGNSSGLSGFGFSFNSPPSKISSSQNNNDSNSNSGSGTGGRGGIHMSSSSSLRSQPLSLPLPLSPMDK